MDYCSMDFTWTTGPGRFLFLSIHQPTPPHWSTPPLRNTERLYCNHSRHEIGLIHLFERPASYNSRFSFYMCNDLLACRLLWFRLLWIWFAYFYLVRLARELTEICAVWIKKQGTGFIGPSIISSPWLSFGSSTPLFTECFVRIETRGTQCS